MKVFYVNLKFGGGVLKSNAKGVQMEITRKAWKDVAGLRQREVHVKYKETKTVEEFKIVQYFGQCVRNPGVQIHNFHVGRLLRIDERLLAMIMIKMIVLRGEQLLKFE